jgi:hypothetical protein
VNLKRRKLLKSKTSINKILFNVKKLFVIMFVIFSLVRKLIKNRWLSTDYLISYPSALLSYYSVFL